MRVLIEGQVVDVGVAPSQNGREPLEWVKIYQPDPRGERPGDFAELWGSGLGNPKVGTTVAYTASVSAEVTERGRPRLRVYGVSRAAVGVDAAGVGSKVSAVKVS